MSFLLFFLHYSKKCCNFAAQTKVCRHNKKRLLRGPHNFKQWGVLSACFGVMKSGKFEIAQNKKVPRFMYIYTNGAFGADVPQALFKTDAQWDISEQESYEKVSFSFIDFCCPYRNIM